jgi:hypothetical protein
MENFDIFKQTVVGDENLTYIFIHPICEIFEINLHNQQRFIQNDGILSSLWTKKSNNLMFGDNRQRTALTKIGFLRWIQLINPSIVKPELQDKLRQYQTLIFNYINGEGLVPNIKNIYSLERRNMAIDAEVKQLIHEKKRNMMQIQNLKNNNYGQLGLEVVYNEEGRTLFIESNKKAPTLIIENQ